MLAVQEMPGYDASLSLAEGGELENENAGPDPFADWAQGNAYVLLSRV